MRRPCPGEGPEIGGLHGEHQGPQQACPWGTAPSAGTHLGLFGGPARWWALLILGPPSPGPTGSRAGGRALGRATSHTSEGHSGALPPALLCQWPQPPRQSRSHSLSSRDVLLALPPPWAPQPAHPPRTLSVSSQSLPRASMTCWSW